MNKVATTLPRSPPSAPRRLASSPPLVDTTHTVQQPIVATREPLATTELETRLDELEAALGLQHSDSNQASFLDDTVADTSNVADTTKDSSFHAEGQQVA